MDTLPDHTPTGWTEALTRSKAQIEAGQTVPMKPVLDRLRASIARMEARQSDRAEPTADKA